MYASYPECMPGSRVLVRRGAALPVFEAADIFKDFKLRLAGEWVKVGHGVKS